MSRIATVPLQNILSGSIQRSQQKLAVSQAQLASGKKATDVSDLGIDAVRTLSSRALMSRQNAYVMASDRVSATMTLYNTHLSGIESSSEDLRRSLLEVIGTGRSAGIQEQIESSFAQLKTSLNASEGGVPLFAGSQTEDIPFTPNSLSDLIPVPPSNAFTNDKVRPTARLSDGLDITYGVVADEVATGLVTAFSTLATAGPFGDTLTAAQLTAVTNAIDQLDSALKSVREVSAENGRKQAQIETFGTRANERATLLQTIVGKVEDADLGQVAIDISVQKTALEASLTVFSQLSKLSLVNYLN